MAITIIVTNAGRAALVNAANTGTNAVTITQMGVSETAFVPDAAQVALPGEIKRIASVSGVVVADDVIHVTVSDSTAATYSMRGLAFYLADGTLFAIYGQAGAILNKTAESMMLLALDIAFADIDAEMIEFGDTNFILPQATTEILGLVELATTAEAQAGADAQRVLTPLTGKQSVLGWILSQDGSGSGLDADLLDGMHASAFAAAGHTHDRGALTGFGTMAAQNANSVAIAGGSIDGATLSNIAGAAGLGCAALASTKLQVRIGADRRFSVFANGADNVFGYLTDAGNWADTFLNGSALRFGIGGVERARIDATGNVGINVLNPTERFQVGTGAGIFSIAPFGGASAQVKSSGGMGYDVGVASAHQFMISGVEAARLNGTGLGIGVSPAVRLHVKSFGETLRLETTAASGGGSNYVRFTDPAGAMGFLGFAGANNTMSLHNELNGSIQFVTNGGTRLVLDVTGNLTPAVDGGQILGWSTARWKEGHFSDFVRVGGNNVWHAGNDGAGSLLDADLLDGRQAFEFVLDSNFTGGGVLSRLLTVDGAGSGLDADLLDGQHGAYYLPAASYTAADVLAKLLGVDGAGSGLDADLLDGLQAADFVKLADFIGSNQNIGQPGRQRFPGGFMIQTGNYSVFANSTTTVTFNTSFNSICLGCICSGGRQDFAAQDNNPFVSSFNIGGATIYSSSDNNCSGSYLAIGF